MVAASWGCDTTYSDIINALLDVRERALRKPNRSKWRRATRTQTLHVHGAKSSVFRRGGGTFWAASPLPLMLLLRLVKQPPLCKYLTLQFEVPAADSEFEQQHRDFRAAELGLSGSAVRSCRHALVAVGGADAAFLGQRVQLLLAQWPSVALRFVRSRSGCAVEYLGTDCSCFSRNLQNLPD